MRFNAKLRELYIANRTWRIKSKKDYNEQDMKETGKLGKDLMLRKYPNGQILLIKSRLRKDVTEI